jgi:hypothetical protein
MAARDDEWHASSAYRRAEPAMAGRPWPPVSTAGPFTVRAGISRRKLAKSWGSSTHPSGGGNPTIHARGKAVALAWLDLLDELADELEQDGPRAQQ